MVIFFQGTPLRVRPSAISFLFLRLQRNEFSSIKESIIAAEAKKQTKKDAASVLRAEEGQWDFEIVVFKFRTFAKLQNSQKCQL